MTAENDRRADLKARIAASQNSLDSDIHTPSPDFNGETVASRNSESALARHPWLTIAAAAGAGIALGAVLPRGWAKKTMARTGTLAATGAQLATAWSRFAADRSQKLARHGRSIANDRTDGLRDRVSNLGETALHRANDIADSARDRGADILDAASRLVRRAAAR